MTSRENAEAPRGSVNTQPEALLNAGQAAAFLGLSRGYLYKLTSRHEVPFIKYGGRLILFDREALTAWKASRMQTIPTRGELAARAETYCTLNPLEK